MKNKVDAQIIAEEIVAGDQAAGTDIDIYKIIFYPPWRDHPLGGPVWGPNLISFCFIDLDFSPPYG